MGRSRGYIIFLCILFFLLLVGVGLLIYGSTQQGALPRPTLMVPRDLLYG